MEENTWQAGIDDYEDCKDGKISHKVGSTKTKVYSMRLILCPFAEVCIPQLQETAVV